MFAIPTTRQLRRIIREVGRELCIGFKDRSWTDKTTLEHPAERQVCMNPTQIGCDLLPSQYDELISRIRNRLAENNLLIVQGLSDHQYVRFYGVITPKQK